MSRHPETLPALLQEMFANSELPAQPWIDRLQTMLTRISRADAHAVAHLHAFFRGCYHDGAFTASQPHPTSHGEVTFHWVHAGQSYAKGNKAGTGCFIHPDLEGFLRRELDRFLKETVVELDEGNEASEDKTIRSVRQIREVRRLAKPIIALLAEREAIRKRAWLRQKRVVETHYCFALHCVPDELYDEVAVNDAQRAEWVRLFGIDRMEDETEAGYAVPLSSAFLHAHRYLPVDTAFFGQGFKDRLLAAQADLDDALSAVVLHCDSAHGLSFILARYAERIDTIYIDPPFNTDNTEFLYKNDYGHSPWLSMMEGLLRLARPLLSNDGSLFAQIDHHEVTHLKMLLNQVFGEERFVNEIIWRRKQATSYSRKQLGVINDTIWWFAKSATFRFVPQYTRDDDHTQRYIAERFVYLDAATGRRYMKSPLVNSMDRPNLKFNFHGVPPPSNGWLYSQEKMEELFQKGELVLPDKPGGRIYRKIFADTYPGQRIQNVWLDIPIVNPMAHERIEGFATQKPAALVERIVALSTGPESVVLDFFAGSGTSFQAVLDANRKDGGRRRVVLMEMGDHFDGILLPRLKRLLAERAEARSGFKYLRLESYQEALRDPAGDEAWAGDVVETFNWLLGLTVERIWLIDGVRVVKGANPRGQKVLILWRDENLFDSDGLVRWLDEHGTATGASDCKVIYVNGSPEGLNRTGHPSLFRCIEDEFRRLLHDDSFVNTLEGTKAPKTKQRRANS